MAVQLLIAIPNYKDSVAGKFLDCFLRLSVHLARKFAPGELQYMRIGLTYIDIARNKIWLHARQCGAQNLLCLDDDMTFTPETFETLWNTPGDIVSALYFVRGEPPTSPAMYRQGADGSYQPILTYRQNDVLPVDAVGMGFALIRKPVLDAMAAPFTRDSSKGEDIVFCERARAAGFSVAVNTGAKAGHLFTYPFEINETNAGGTVADLYRAMTRPAEAGRHGGSVGAGFSQPEDTSG